MDPFAVEVGNRDVATVVFAIGGRLVPYPAGVLAQHRVLVPEHEQLGILRQVFTEYQNSQAE